MLSLFLALTGRNIFEPVKHENLKMLGGINKKVNVTLSKNKVTQHKQEGNVTFKLFIKSQNQVPKLDLKVLMMYPLTAVTHSIRTPDGFLAETAKVQGLRALKI